jgi:hypothetical protein
MAHSQITPEQQTCIYNLVPQAYKQTFTKKGMMYTFAHTPHILSDSCIEVTCIDGTKCIVNTGRNKVSYAYIKRQSTDCPHVIALEDASGNTCFLHTETMKSVGWYNITSLIQVPELPVLELKFADGATGFLHTETMESAYWSNITSFTQVSGLPVLEVKDADGVTRFLHTETMKISGWHNNITSFTQVPGLPVLELKFADGFTRFLHTETMESNDWWSNITSFTQVQGLPVLAMKRANGTTAFLQTETMKSFGWHNITSFTQVPGLPVLELKFADGFTRFLHTETMKSTDWTRSWSVINPSHPHIIRIVVGRETRVYNLLSMEVLQVYATERLVSIDIVDGEIVVTKKEVLILPQSPR